MKIIVTNGSYGFGKNWTLQAYGKEFWLGQDVKVCKRALGMEPKDVIAEIGTAEIERPSGNKKLARLICKVAGINRSNVGEFQPWSLAVE